MTIFRSRVRARTEVWGIIIWAGGCWPLRCCKSVYQFGVSIQKRAHFCVKNCRKGENWHFCAEKVVPHSGHESAPRSGLVFWHVKNRVSDQKACTFFEEISVLCVVGVSGVSRWLFTHPQSTCGLFCGFFPDSGELVQPGSKNRV